MYNGRYENRDMVEKGLLVPVDRVVIESCRLPAETSRPEAKGSKAGYQAMLT